MQRARRGRRARDMHEPALRRHVQHRDAEHLEALRGRQRLRVGRSGDALRHPALRRRGQRVRCAEGGRGGVRGRGRRQRWCRAGAPHRRHSVRAQVRRRQAVHQRWRARDVGEEALRPHIEHGDALHVERLRRGERRRVAGPCQAERQPARGRKGQHGRCPRRLRRRRGRSGGRRRRQLEVRTGQPAGITARGHELPVVAIALGLVAEQDHRGALDQTRDHCSVEARRGAQEQAVAVGSHDCGRARFERGRRVPGGRRSERHEERHDGGERRRGCCGARCDGRNSRPVLHRTPARTSRRPARTDWRPQARSAPVAHPSR